MKISAPFGRLLPASTSASLLRLAALFLTLYATALTLSPAVRDRTFSGLGELRWMHWLGILAWVLSLFWLDRRARRALPNRDPFLIPVAGLLSGWGLLTIWRLTTEFGLRQSIWLAVSSAAFVAGLHYKDRVLNVLRRYKYVWLLAGFLITALTFLFGTNPSQIGPELWLGCCGLYFQPSELLKLLLIVYLAAYLADRQPLMSGLLPLLAPTALMTGAALLLLMIQRDLGTAWVFIFIYTILIYIAAGKRRVLLASLAILTLALVAGYELVSLVHARIESWLNPWLDPSGASYQIVQGILAIANGGLFGRGPGMGAPGFVPVSHSDFIYTSIVEENGLAGAIALLALIMFLAVRALRISLHARDAYQRYLAIGLSAYLASQSLLIIGGNIRLLPLTGVTLPFVSYGGSSMLVSFFALFLLCLVSNDAVSRSTPLLRTRPIILTAGGMLAAFGAVALVTGWWSVARGPDLLTRPDNARRALSDLYVMRGALLDRNEQLLSQTVGSSGEYTRHYLHSRLGNILGYSSAQFGQSGLENGLDGILRGEEYQPPLTLWMDHILYGQPAPGLDVKLSLDLNLELGATRLLQDKHGAAVLLDAGSGEILAMASQPGFDASTLETDWEQLLLSPDSPLLNRAAQGAYPPGAALGPFLLATANSDGVLPAVPAHTTYELNGQTLRCTTAGADASDWNALIAAGCPGALAELGLALGEARLLSLFTNLGFYQAPAVPIEIHSQTRPANLSTPGEAATGQGGLLVSPLQMALAAAALSNGGQVPPGQLVLSIKDAQGGWREMESDSAPAQALTSVGALSQAQKLANADLGIWELSVRVAAAQGRFFTWYVAGSLPGNGGTRLAIAVLLENGNTAQAREIGRSLLAAAQE
jgi:cell division protein FtsW (lipid II flippase)